ncbi:MAG: DUF1624 domain-containing protein [Deltaproteobacteria bacterium]|nr:DUF1624 domain-containing protein [Deltaproteobacteria bacterium]
MSTKARIISTADDRLVFVDVLRGIAVTAMICYHTADAWIRQDVREGEIWALIRSAGGLAAPLFLTLAGISLGLKATVGLRRGDEYREVTRACLIRGFQLVILGYLLRLQMWLLDFGAIQNRKAWLPATLLLSAYLLAYLAIGRLSRLSYAQLAGLLALSGLLFSFGINRIIAFAPHRVEGILRMDILQSIGVSLAVASVVGVSTDIFRKRPYLAMIIAVAIVCATPIIKRIMPGPLPEALASFFVYWEPDDGRKAIAFFPLFPWMAYLFAGITIGNYWERAKSRGRLASSVALFSAFGVLTAFVCYESHSIVFAFMTDYPIITQPLRVFYRIGAVLAVSGIAFLSSRSWIAKWLPFRTMGGASLLVYWVHLEFAYGVVSKPLYLRLEILEWWWGVVALTALMTGLAWLRIRASGLTTWWSRSGYAIIRDERS